MSAWRSSTNASLLSTSPKTRDSEMIEKLIHLLIVGLVLFIVYFICGLFVAGMILNIIGAILALVFCLFALKLFGIINI